MQREYASEVAETLTKLGLYVDVDNGENTLPKKVRNGEIAQYNFILGACPCLPRAFAIPACADSCSSALV